MHKPIVDKGLAIVFDIAYHPGMSLVALKDIQASFGPHVVLDGLDWEIQRGEKVGLVGPNGSGKTTLFRLILNEVKPQIGQVIRSRGLQIAYLSQEPELDSQATLFDEVRGTFANLQQLEERLTHIGQEIADHHDTNRLDELMAEYDELHHRLEAAGGYRYETLVKEVLGGLGFSSADLDQPIATFSGGQKCRAALAKLLLQETDLLLLDEPTNHLDIEATRFLEQYLVNYHGTVIVVSHDRYLLDRVADKIADLEGKRITVYSCGYSDYAESKLVREITGQREYEKQQVWLAHQREYAERVKADKSRAKQARGRLRMLERMERDGKIIDSPAHSRRKMAIDFSPASHAGDMVLRCRNLRKAFGEVVLFDDLDLEIYRGEKIGIIGPNGVGKTTLLKMAMRRIEPDSGQIRLYENLQIGYYDQEQIDLDRELTVIQTIAPSYTGSQEKQIRSFLAGFLFSGDQVFKRVGDLSGGEQSRVTLAALVWKNPQVLVLDEPTNHLDIPGKEALEEALIAYEGAILLVSHDRYFLDRVVNKLLVLPERGRYELLPGNWSTYEKRLIEREAAKRAAAEQARADARRANRLRQKQKVKAKTTAESGVNSPYARWSLERLEEEIIEREEQVAAVEHQFSDPNIYRDPGRAKTLRQQVEQLRTELTALNAAWETKAGETSQ
ncbi:MAG: ABC-F family ATP-binding cassette domain-containing protein [Phycisphaerales bacterium]|nr:ABC-F family ATP-binding cassette domain-containing protein [Phycisphaerales bacterium]